jgi:hypothetical protein
MREKHEAERMLKPLHPNRSVHVLAACSTPSEVGKGKVNPI